MEDNALILLGSVVGALLVFILQSIVDIFEVRVKHGLDKEQLEKDVADLQAEVKELKRQQALNSRND